MNNLLWRLCRYARDSCRAEEPGKFPSTQQVGDTKDMNEAKSTLIKAAKAVCGTFKLRENFSAGSIGAAILTAQGNIYTGICIDLACGLGFCAEVAAVAEMLKARETHVAAVVAVSNDGVLVAPCGRCRETIAQVDRQNLDCAVILGDDREVPLREFLPEHWLSGQ
jgi:cytidine deaminase